MTFLFRTKGWLSVAQLVRAWGLELATAGQDPNQCQRDLEHLLLEDIVKGRIDNAGPLRKGRRPGLRLEFEGRPFFAKGHEIHALICPTRWFSLDKILVMKEAALDFASRHKLPPPSWWTDDTSPLTDAGLACKAVHSITGSATLIPTHSARRRGRRSKKLGQVKEAMGEDIRQGRLTIVALRDMRETDLAARYGVSRDTARKARDAVLSETSTMTELSSAIPSST